MKFFIRSRVPSHFNWVPAQKIIRCGKYTATLVVSLRAQDQVVDLTPVYPQGSWEVAIPSHKLQPGIDYTLSVQLRFNADVDMLDTIYHIGGSPCSLTLTQCGEDKVTKILTRKVK